MGGTVFEVSTSPKNWQNLDAENNHILIILYPDLKTMEGIANFYEDWRFLFYYRNKIVWAYSNTQQIKPMLKANLLPADKSKGQVQFVLPKVKLSESNLENLEQSLEENYRDLVCYAENIAFLEIQRQTIKTNLYKFQQRLKSIQNKAEEVARNSTNLDIINKFSEIVEHKYLAQVEQDYVAFSPGLKLRDKWIDTIRGIVEIRQVQLSKQKEERDQKFQDNIAILGVGLGSAAIASTAISPFIESITQRPSIDPESNLPLTANALLNFSAIIGFSIVIGFISSRAILNSKRRDRL